MGLAPEQDAVPGQGGMRPRPVDGLDARSKLVAVRIVLGPRTGQRPQRYHAHPRWFAGNLLATGPSKVGQESVCAGGRDRDRTCDFCRVKRVRPPDTPFPHPASQCVADTQVSRCDSASDPGLSVAE
jgi:hypothetical protein